MLLSDREHDVDKISENNFVIQDKQTNKQMKHKYV